MQLYTYIYIWYFEIPWIENQITNFVFYGSSSDLLQLEGGQDQFIKFSRDWNDTIMLQNYTDLTGEIVAKKGSVSLPFPRCLCESGPVSHPTWEVK